MLDTGTPVVKANGRNPTDADRYAGIVYAREIRL
jgi:hypothetical protein